MNRYAMLIALTLAATLGASELARPDELRAQVGGRVPIFLVIPESYPDVDGRVVLLREPGRDIVLLRADDATPQTLSVALDLLARINERTPRREGQGQMVPVTGYALRSPLPKDEHERLETAITQLRARPLASVGNLGLGRSIPFVGREG